MSHDVTTTEVQRLWMIKRAFGDEVPVPENYGWQVDEENYVFIYIAIDALMDEVSISNFWESLNSM